MTLEQESKIHKPNLVVTEEKVVDQQSHTEDDECLYKHLSRMVDELTFRSTLDTNGGPLDGSPMFDPFVKPWPPPYVDLPHLTSSFAPVIITSTTKGHFLTT